MKTKHPETFEVSVVVPIYNEEDSVGPLLQKIYDAMNSVGRSFEVVLVDDGSTDGTRDLLREAVLRYPHLRVIFFRKNYGQTPAMVAGFDYARGKVIVTMDGDLQNDPADIRKILDKMEEGFEVVSGWRYKRQDKLITRKIPSMIANRLISILTGVRLHNYGCSLKAYRADCIRSVNAYSEMHRFFPAVASITGARTAEIPVGHFARQFGKSKYGISRTFKVFADLFTIFMITKFTSKPNALFAFLAVPFFLLGSLFTIVTVESYFQPAVPSVIWMGAALLFLMLGFHFLFLSALGSLIIKRGKLRPEQLAAITASIS